MKFLGSLCQDCFFRWKWPRLLITCLAISPSILLSLDADLPDFSPTFPSSMQVSPSKPPPHSSGETECATEKGRAKKKSARGPPTSRAGRPCWKNIAMCEFALSESNSLFLLAKPKLESSIGRRRRSSAEGVQSLLSYVGPFFVSESCHFLSLLLLSCHFILEPRLPIPIGNDPCWQFPIKALLRWECVGARWGRGGLRHNHATSPPVGG